MAMTGIVSSLLKYFKFSQAIKQICRHGDIFWMCETKFQASLHVRKYVLIEVFFHRLSKSSIFVRFTKSRINLLKNKLSLVRMTQITSWGNRAIFCVNLSPPRLSFGVKWRKYSSFLHILLGNMISFSVKGECLKFCYLAPFFLNWQFPGQKLIWNLSTFFRERYILFFWP